MSGGDSGRTRLPDRQLAWVLVRNSWTPELARFRHAGYGDCWEFFGESRTIAADAVEVIELVEVRLA